jgi:hypothetical protein
MKDKKVTIRRAIAMILASILRLLGYRAGGILKSFGIFEEKDDSSKSSEEYDSEPRGEHIA